MKYIIGIAAVILIPVFVIFTIPFLWMAFVVYLGKAAM
jgi:hypothetical protein